MRTNIFVLAFIFGALVIGAIVFILFNTVSKQSAQQKPKNEFFSHLQAQGGKSKASPARSLSAQVVANVERSSVRADTNTLTLAALNAISEDEKFAILDSLQEAALCYSPEGLPVIEPFLFAPNPEIRAAAADALVTLGEASGSALLRKAASKSQDPKEAADLIAKAEYLELLPGKLFFRDRATSLPLPH